MFVLAVERHGVGFTMSDSMKLAIGIDAEDSNHHSSALCTNREPFVLLISLIQIMSRINFSSM